MVQRIDADLGGTEMKAALEAAIRLPIPADAVGADILLVTDGEVWNAQALISAARDSNHRVFAIGVGSSPAEAVLRQLAEATGGACEFATPGEALEAAAVRMMGRIRKQPWREARVDWGCVPVWQTPLPLGVFGGDTMIVYAGVKDARAWPTVRLLASDGNATREIARAEAEDVVAGDALPRIAASRRLVGAGEEEARGLAVAYQLLSPHTNCILVHERAKAGKVTEEAQLHQVSTMLAAGWGATSRAVPGASGLFAASSFERSHDLPVRATRAHYAPAPEMRMPNLEVDAFNGGEIFARSIAFEGSDVFPPATLACLTSPEDLLAAVVATLRGTGAVTGLSALDEALPPDAAVRPALKLVCDLLGSNDAGWLLLAHWLERQSPDAARAALLAPHLDQIDPTQLARSLKLFDQHLAPALLRPSMRSRAARLTRALGL
jgi:hypothetical protein